MDSEELREGAGWLHCGSHRNPVSVPKGAAGSRTSCLQASSPRPFWLSLALLRSSDPQPGCEVGDLLLMGGWGL